MWQTATAAAELCGSCSRRLHGIMVDRFPLLQPPVLSLALHDCPAIFSSSCPLALAVSPLIMGLCRSRPCLKLRDDWHAKYAFDNPKVCLMECPKYSPVSTLAAWPSLSPAGPDLARFGVRVKGLVSGRDWSRSRGQGSDRGWGLGAHALGRALGKSYHHFVTRQLPKRQSCISCWLMFLACKGVDLGRGLGSTLTRDQHS